MAGDCNPENVFFSLIKEREEVDRLTESLLGRPFKAFGPISHPVPNLRPAEVGFLRSIAYLYATYQEVGRVSVGYLSRVLSAYGLDPSGRVASHVAHVEKLRTYLQHNLNPANVGDLGTIRTCEDWLSAQCGSRVPATEEQWLLALCALINEALTTATVFNRAIRAIEADESRDEMLSQWRFEFERFHGPEEFDRVISAAASDMGYPYLDVVRFRKRFYDRWQDKLRALHTGYDFQSEARRLVEQSLIADAAVGLPLTGADILATFGVSPGPIVRVGLEMAFSRFQQSPCGREELIQYLREAGYPGDGGPVPQGT
jgi:hypothetical protein